MFEATDIRERRGHDAVEQDGHRIGEHRLVFAPLNQATVGQGYLKVCYDKNQVKDAPSIGTDGELPAGDEAAIFARYGLMYEPRAGGARLLARR